MPLQLIGNGFLPTRGSLMLDVVFLAIFLIPLVLTISIYLVRAKRKFRLHKKIQLAMTVVVLVTLVAFEVDLRLFIDWRKLAAASPLYASGWVDIVLWIHLCFAIPTPLVWLATVIMALRNFPADPIPGKYSRRHRFWGRLSALLMYLTSITGCVFYIVGFVL